MAYTDAQRRATRKYNDKAYERITVTVAKGDREKYKALAEQKGVSLNRLIVNYLDSLLETK